jgi:hypothetical protein
VRRSSLPINTLLLLAMLKSEKEAPMSTQTRNTKAVIELVNGTRLEGDMICGASGRLESVLYQDVSFIEFHMPDGRIMFINKLQVAMVEPVKFVREHQTAA